MDWGSGGCISDKLKKERQKPKKEVQRLYNFCSHIGCPLGHKGMRQVPTSSATGNTTLEFELLHAIPGKTGSRQVNSVIKQSISSLWWNTTKSKGSHHNKSRYPPNQFKVTQYTEKQHTLPIFKRKDNCKFSLRGYRCQKYQIGVTIPEIN